LREEGAEEADVKWSFKWIGCWPVGMALQGFVRNNADIGVGERAETVKLIEAVEQAEEAINRDGCGGIGSAAFPELRGGSVIEQKNEKHERDTGEQV